MTKKKEHDGEGITFFGGVDRYNGKPDARITSQYPAWYFQNLIENLEEEVEQDERSLTRSSRLKLFDREQIERQREQIGEKKERLEQLKSSKPKMSGAQKDRYWKIRQELGDQIRNYLFTTSEMKMGTASAHEEADRMSQVSDIKLPPDVIKSLNLQHNGNGMVSRTQAEIGYKIISSYFGEDSNIEAIRRDRTTARTFKQRR